MFSNGESAQTYWCKPFNDFDPDLLDIQELRAFQGWLLRERLPHFDFFVVGLDDAKKKGEFSTAPYRKERLDQRNGGMFCLSQTPEVAGNKGKDAVVTCIVTWTKLQNRSRGATFFFFNTQRDHIGRQVRRTSARWMRSQIAPLGGALIVVTGDFNAGEDSDPYRMLVGGPRQRLLASFREACPVRSEGEVPVHGLHGGGRCQGIERILRSPHVAAIEAAMDFSSRDGRYPSIIILSTLCFGSFPADPTHGVLQQLSKGGMLVGAAVVTEGDADDSSLGV